MDDLNKNIQETINSLDGLQKPELSPLMADRIWRLALESKSKQKSETVMPSKGLVWIAGLSAVVVLNLAFLHWNTNNSLNNEQAESSLTSIYFDSEISY